MAQDEKPNSSPGGGTRSTSVHTTSNSARSLAVSQFNDKMSVLNKDFLKTIQAYINEEPRYDLCPVLQSYIGHVSNLEEMYGLAKKKKKEPAQEKTTHGRKLAIAKRRSTGKKISESEKGESKGKKKEKTPMSSVSFAHGDSLDTSTLQRISTPASGSVPPRMNVNLSAIDSESTVGTNGGKGFFQFGKTPSSASNAPYQSSSEKTLTSTAPESGPGPIVGGRKRAIRGGGPLGDSEVVMFRGQEKNATVLSPLVASAPKMPPINFELPKANPDFWKQTSKSTLVSSEKPTESDDKTSESASEKEPASAGGPLGTFRFGATTTSSSPSKPLFSFTASSMASSSSSTITTSAINITTSAPSTFFGFKPLAKTDAPLSFGSSSSTGTSSAGPLPTLSFPSFASQAASAAKASAPSAAEPGGEEEEGEYVPPKAEVVENAEPDAILSMKCAVHKLAEKSFEKLGVGMLHVKEKKTEGGAVTGKTLLVRAATATGTIWINANIDETMKATKADDTKIRVACPLSSTEVGTFLLRLSSTEEAKKILEHLQLKKD